jgi:hypothetical protein
MGRGVVEVVVELLDIFSVVSFGACQAEKALFENTVSPIPHCKRKA